MTHEARSNELHITSYILRTVYFTSSNFLALYCSAPFRKFSNMMSHSTVPYIIRITNNRLIFGSVYQSWEKKNHKTNAWKITELLFVVSCPPVKLTTPTDVNAATMLMSVGIMLNFPAYKGRTGLYQCVVSVC